MFGLFKKKSFEQEMAEFHVLARKVRNKMDIDNMMFMDPMKEMEIMQSMLMEAKKINNLRIDCCRRHNRPEELKHWLNVNNSI